MSKTFKALVLVVVTAVLAACTTGGPPKRIWPPQVSLHQLAVQDDGSWLLGLRLQNFSTVAMSFERLDLELALAGQSPFSVVAAPGLRIGPGSAEVFELRLPPDFENAGLVADALQTRSGVRYRLQGRVVTSDPSGNHATEFESVLNAVPGLPGVLR